MNVGVGQNQAVVEPPDFDHDSYGNVINTRLVILLITKVNNANQGFMSLYANIRSCN